MGKFTQSVRRIAQDFQDQGTPGKLFAYDHVDSFISKEVTTSQSLSTYIWNKRLMGSGEMLRTDSIYAMYSSAKDY